jgi:CubicO group peptidase (beta-lactamase class C family)
LRRGAPLKGTHLTTLETIAYRVVESGAAPSAAVATATRLGAGSPSSAFEVRSGVAGAPRLPEPIFDLASVTKPFVAVTAARLVRQGLFQAKDPLGRLLPELADTPSGGLSFLTFLAHRAGLEAHRPLFAPLAEGRPVERRAFLVEAATARRNDCPGSTPPEGFPPLYSDLGYLLVGAALERVSGVPLDTLVDREVCRPLGLDVRSARLFRSETRDFDERVQPTETVAFRGGEIRGVTHDENAWAFAGHGLAGHAGLFGTAEAVARFGCAVLDAVAGRLDAFLTPSEIGSLIAPRPGGSLRAGFDGKSGPSSAAGTLASDQTFGHLGFTGTSLWCDPVAERVTVLLSNRVCPTRENLLIRALRPEVQDLLYRAT